MRKAIVLCSAMFIVLFLAACGDDVTDTDTNENNDVSTLEDDAENTEEQEQVADDDEAVNEAVEKQEDNNIDESEQAEDQDDMKKMMEDVNFDEIEIEISYGSDQEYEVEIERHDNGDVKAEIEDELTGEDIDNDLEAFNKLYPLVKQLEMEQATDKEDVIQQVLDVFDLEDDYEEFEVEIKFDDGTELSYED